ncbi:MAG: hypothetical protein AAF503_01740 [Pseudomonadota bacterium]
MATDWLLEEYKAVWNFYIRTIESRENVIDFYFKTIAIPTGIIVALTAMFRVGIFGTDLIQPASDTQSFYMDACGVLLLFVFLIGFGIFLYYSKETRVSLTYRRYLGEIIEKAKASNTELRVIDLNPMATGVSQTKTVLFRAAFLRISPIVLINSGVLGLGFFAFLVEGSLDTATIAAFAAAIGSVVAHAWVFYADNH